MISKIHRTVSSQPLLSWSYDLPSLVYALGKVGLKRGDLVYSHLSIFNLGMAREFRMNYNPAKLIYDAFYEVIGPEGTLITPTFTYSFCRDEIYDPLTSPSLVGNFGEWLRCQPGTVRSIDPLFSCCGIGPAAKTLFENLPNNSFGEGCLYSRLAEQNAILCNIGLTIHWNTGIYHLDWKNKVPYRYDKVFRGKILLNNQLQNCKWTYFVRVNIPETEPNFHVFHSKAEELGLLKTADIGRSFVCCIPMKEMDCLYETLATGNPWVGVSGPSCDVEVRDFVRAGENNYQVDISSKSSCHEILSALSFLPRDEMSLGFSTSVEALTKVIPLRVISKKSGEHCGKMIVPECWFLRGASIRNIKGDVLLDERVTRLSCARYSRPISKTVSRSTLLEHLHSFDPSSPGHFLSFYLNQGWGFSVTEEFINSLNEEEYRVEIDSDFYYGSLQMAECSAGSTYSEADEIVFITRLDGSYQISNGLSGVVLGVEIMRYILTLANCRYKYRLLILPGKNGLCLWNDVSSSGNRHFILLNDLCNDDCVFYGKTKSADCFDELIDMSVLKMLNLHHLNYELVSVDEDFISDGMDGEILHMSSLCGTRLPFRQDKADLIDRRVIEGFVDLLRNLVQSLEKVDAGKKQV